ncbi:uncharacterized protein LOC110395024 [Numida meleagris]|uniref:uncharacterized protein LOC110395024 n=1 Tax=Numida meleagris TaxID=8996 RepID=UPI000B3E0354|nr:uncharacterized protein LOC110395024 [Numida meleagris]
MPRAVLLPEPSMGSRAHVSQYLGNPFKKRLCRFAVKPFCLADSSKGAVPEPPLCAERCGRSVRRCVRRSAGRCCCSDGNPAPAGSSGAERAGQPPPPPPTHTPPPVLPPLFFQHRKTAAAASATGGGVRIKRCPGQLCTHSAWKPGGTRGGDPPPFPLPVPAELRAVRSTSPGPAAPGRRGHSSPGPDGASAARPPGSVRRDPGSPDPRGRERRAAAPAPDGGRRSALPTDGREPYTPTVERPRAGPLAMRTFPRSPLPAPGPTCGGGGGGCGSRRGGSGCSGGGASRSAAAGAAPRRAALPFFVSGKLRALTQAVTGAGPARSRARPASCPPGRGADSGPPPPPPRPARRGRCPRGARGAAGRYLTPEKALGHAKGLGIRKVYETHEEGLTLKGS